MAEKYDPPMSEALMALFATAAPLFERAKAAGIFRPPVNAAAEVPASPPAPPPLPADDGAAAQKAALQEIIVAQAMKIVALEAEVARLKG